MYIPVKIHNTYMLFLFFDIPIKLPTEPLGILKDTRESRTHGIVPMPYPRYGLTCNLVSMPIAKLWSYTKSHIDAIS